MQAPSRMATRILTCLALTFFGLSAVSAPSHLFAAVTTTTTGSPTVSLGAQCATFCIASYCPPNDHSCVRRCEHHCIAEKGTCRTWEKNDVGCNKPTCRVGNTEGACVNTGKNACHTDGSSPSCDGCKCEYRAQYDECLCW